MQSEKDEIPEEFKTEVSQIMAMRKELVDRIQVAEGAINQCKFAIIKMDERLKEIKASQTTKVVLTDLS